MTELEQAFVRWQTMVELQLKYIETLGEHKLQAAKAELLEAVASEHWAVARMKTALAIELEAVLKRLRRQRHRSRHEMETLRRHARSAAKIRSGEDLPPDQLALMWAAYTVFERRVSGAVLDRLARTPVDSAARSGTNFVDPRRRDRVGPDVPQEIDNVLGLVSWLRHERLMPRRGTAAYRQVIAAFGAIAESATTEIELLQKALTDLERQTFDTWQPTVLMALPDNVDVKKLLRLGSR